MTEHATTDADTPATGEPKPAESVVDAHTTETAPEPAVEGAELQEQIAEKAAHISEAPEPAPATEAAPEAPAEAAPEPAPEPQAESESAPDEVEEPADTLTAEAPSEPTESEPATEESPATTQDEGAAKPAKKPRTPRAPKAAAATAAPADPAETPDATVTPTEEPVEPKPENKKKWYAIKVQSGREDTIKAAILRKVAIEGLEDVFGQIMIPFEEVIEKKSVKVKDKKTGEYTTQEKKVVRKKKKFQGYLFAELEFNDRMLYLFRETSGVGDFLNLRTRPGEAPTPEPMPDHEVQAMLTGVSVKPGGPAKKVKLEFEKGDRVRIKEGSFANSEGEVKAISEPKDPTDPPKITVVVTFWGRPLDVELEYWQVAKV